VTAESVRQCGTCGAADRYPSGKCRPCTQARNSGNVAYFRARNAAARAEDVALAATTTTRRGVIYGLYDPAGALRYVGQTQVDVRRRLSQHANGPGGPYAYLPVYRWIAKLQSDGHEPEMRLLAGPMHVAELDHVERSEIAAAWAAGCRLTNIDEGGRTALKTRRMPEDAIRRSAEAKRGKPRSAETRAKLSAANEGKRPSAETLAKRSAALRGRKQSPEWIAKRVESVARTKAAKQQDVCGRGHSWTEDNTRWYRAHRCCRACAREDARAKRAAAKLAIQEAERTIAA
jgi:hypothetical protein